MQRSFIFQWSQLQRKLASIEEAGRSYGGARAWLPNVDVFESASDLLVRLELAGITPDAVEIQTDESTLTIRGARRDPQSSETAAGYRFRQMEIEFGPFERVITLPFAVDGSQARATYNQGILSIRIPRAPNPQAVRIRIQVGS
ncbi:MAG: Hsp20/alpha crystallin family protein [Kiritimatiellae bacterium]|nr:Hsp20/alpha crystallin family protein [Kiritimatiellia bacterium]